ncbi:inosine-5-monophosphate dehydrogenase [Cryptosporidium canis]|uniref:Inosine-5-monophosphate dehydrogenase n=1 Tax=Cryptosporidium canis TaxID=195482 RepID=A0A9D5DH06_9CRYT|nr:inosine-5-monophosphate dehydrogenase [Cryptosporidium canis]
MTTKRMGKGLTFEDILLVPNYSEVLPKDVCLETKLTRNVPLRIPLISSAMDTVTEHMMAIEMARLGGIGIIHKNMDIESQVNEVLKVKNWINLQKEAAKASQDEQNVWSSLAESTQKQEETDSLYVNANLDGEGRLRVGAAIGVNELERAKLLVEAGVDVIVLDSAHGHSLNVLKTLREIKSRMKVDIIAGNVVTEEAVTELIENGADGIKVGIGPGSICTTRIVAGVGVPQITAIEICSSIGNKYGVPIIADGGIRYSGDIGKALAVGASCVMIGSILAGTEESPGEKELVGNVVYKNYRGMGSIGAMKNGSGDRYFQDKRSESKMVPEGIEGRVKYKGNAEGVVYQLVGGLRSCMGYLGSKNVDELWKKSKYIEITSSGLRESHVHDVDITKEVVNYSK